MRRRGFFAAIAAPFVTRWLPKPKPVPAADSITKLVEWRMSEAQRLMSEEFAKAFYRPNPLFTRLSSYKPQPFNGGLYISRPVSYVGGENKGWYGEEDKT